MRTARTSWTFQRLAQEAAAPQPFVQHNGQHREASEQGFENCQVSAVHLDKKLYEGSTGDQIWSENEELLISVDRSL